MPTNQAKATGFFSLINFNDSITAMENDSFSEDISFLYSGDSVPQVQLVGTDLPDGANISEVIHDGDVLYHFTFFGMVEKPSEYSMTLILTDNQGAILTQPYTLKVVGLNIDITTDSLPNADLHTPYLGTIYFNFVGRFKYPPTISELPIGLTSEFNYKTNNTPGYFSGEGWFTLTGSISSSIRHYDIEIFVEMGGYPQYNKSRTYSLDVNEPTTFAQTPATQTTSDSQNDETNEEDNITNFINSEKEKIITVDDKLSERLKGEILLQVEERGEAWYVNPSNTKRYYMANGDEAYNIMRNLGIGITNDDYNRVLADKNFAKLHSGKIFLQVEEHGEAYYIDFDGNAHYLKDGSEAYGIMRDLELGITNDNLRKIDIGE